MARYRPLATRTCVDSLKMLLAYSAHARRDVGWQYSAYYNYAPSNRWLTS